MSNRQPPHAKDVAERLLGVAIVSENAAHKMVDVLGADYKKFFSGKHQRIAAGIMSLISKGDPVDLTTVTQELREMGELESVGGAFYITDLTTKAGNEYSAETYSRIIVERWIKRQIIEKASSIVGRAHDETSDAFEMLSEAQNNMMEIGVESGSDNGDLSTVADDQMKQHIESTKRRRAGENPITGIATGFPRIDEMTGGFGDEELIIIAARPSMGKSAWALVTGINAAVEQGTRTAIFSLEMSKSQWFNRAVGVLAEVNMQKIARGYGSDDELKRMYEATKKVKDLPFWVIDKPGLGVAGIRAKARRLVQSQGIDMIMVDYLQLINSDAIDANREQQVAQISRQLKEIAMDLGIPVVALSQINRRSLSQGGGKRPQLSHLRESGALEQDADIVSFIHRPERLGIEKHDILEVPSHGLADFIIEKQRNGPVGTVFMKFIEEYAKFKPMDLKAELGEDGEELMDNDQFEGSSIVGQTIPAWAHNLISEEESNDEGEEEEEKDEEETVDREEEEEETNRMDIDEENGPNYPENIRKGSRKEKEVEQNQDPTLPI